MVPSAEDAMDSQRPPLVGITVIRAVQTHSGTAVAKIVKLGASLTGATTTSIVSVLEENATVAL